MPSSHTAVHIVWCPLVLIEDVTNVTLQHASPLKQLADYLGNAGFSPSQAKKSWIRFPLAERRTIVVTISPSFLLSSERTATTVAFVDSHGLGLFWEHLQNERGRQKMYNSLILHSDLHIRVGLILRPVWSQSAYGQYQNQNRGQIQCFSIEVREMLSWTSVDWLPFSNLSRVWWDILLEMLVG